MGYSYFKVDKIEHIRGDAFEASFEISSNYPIADKSIKCQVKQDLDSVDSVLEFSTTTGSITKAGQIITLRKTARQMQVVAGIYEFDVQFSTNQDDVITLFGGAFIVKQDVTQ